MLFRHWGPGAVISAEPAFKRRKIRNENVSNFRFTYYRRNDNVEYGQGDRWKDLMITASEDGENWNYICNGGFITAALALAHNENTEYNALAGEIIQRCPSSGACPSMHPRVIPSRASPTGTTAPVIWCPCWHPSPPPPPTIPSWILPA